MDTSIEKELERRIIRGVTTKLLKKPNYLEFNGNGQLTAVYCKVCGQKIREMRGKRLICLENYKEIELYFSNQTKHVTNCCTTCAPEILSKPDIQDAVYDADLGGWMRESEAGIHHLHLNEKTIDRYALRD